jgi:hypothetical protein
MQQQILIEPQYLPSLEYFCAILPFHTVTLELNEYFVKQSLRNRCYINTAQGMKMLTVPLFERHGKILTKEVLVEQGNQWRNIHWRTIESAYRKAPYFDYYFEELKTILYNGHDLLVDLNRDLMSFCLRHIGLEKNISATLTYKNPSDENILDLRSVISGKKSFRDRGFYRAHTYYQVFGNEFVPNLSVIDLLFCEGPRINQVLRASSPALNK